MTGMHFYSLEESLVACEVFKQSFNQRPLRILFLNSYKKNSQNLKLEIVDT
jgi:hypothetical protein